MSDPVFYDQPEEPPKEASMDLREKLLAICNNSASSRGKTEELLSLIDEELRALVKQNYDLAVLSDANLKAAEARCAKLEEALREYGCHYPECLLAQWHEGRPTKDGGYESRYGDKWYQRDEKPACTCGLAAALAAAKEEGA